jgi:hypothetical protein
MAKPKATPIKKQTLPESHRVTARLTDDEMILINKISEYTGVRAESEILRMGIRALARECKINA